MKIPCLAMSLILLVTGCATHAPKTSTAPITAATASHIAKTQGYLSDIDGKAVSIKYLIK